MIPLQKFKDILGNEAKGLIEDEIIKLKDQMEQMANLFFDMWLEDMKNKLLKNDNQKKSGK